MILEKALYGPFFLLYVFLRPSCNKSSYIERLVIQMEPKYILFILAFSAGTSVTAQSLVQSSPNYRYPNLMLLLVRRPKENVVLGIRLIS